MNSTRNQHRNLSFRLQPHQVQKLDQVQPGMQIVCDKGIIWLTEPDDLQDYALRRGHSIIIRKKGQVLIEAVNEADLHIIYPN